MVNLILAVRVQIYLLNYFKTEKHIATNAVNHVANSVNQ